MPIESDQAQHRHVVCELCLCMSYSPANNKFVPSVNLNDHMSEQHRQQRKVQHTRQSMAHCSNTWTQSGQATTGERSLT